MQTELTVQDRLRAYEYVLDNNKNGFDEGGICNQLHSYLSWETQYQWRNLGSYEAILDCFPELKNRKPVGLLPNQHWFPLNESGDALRLLLLESCIEDCKQQLINKNNQHEERVSND